MEPPKIFWSWQNDYAPNVCRYFIRDALAKATEAAGRDLDLEDAERPALDHDTRNTPGMTDIIAAILKKIEGSAIFVADVTPVAKTADGKALPNPNVLIELGYAMHALGPDRMISVINTASGYEPDDLPFDIRHRRAMAYDLPENADPSMRAKAKTNLVAQLTEALKTNLSDHFREAPASQVVEGVPAKADNPSIWTTFTSPFIFYNSGGFRDHKQSVIVPDGPRAYLRVIPAGWQSEPPTIAQIASLPEYEKVQPWIDGLSHGDFGRCQEGYARLWYTKHIPNETPESTNIAMYFDGAGEFWTIGGDLFAEAQHGLTLRNQALVRGWVKSLAAAIGLFERFGARRPWKVEAGLFGVLDVRWHAAWASDARPASKNACVLERQHRDWNEDAQIGFVTKAYNKVRDIFGFGPITTAELRQLLVTYNPNL
jgi:hypothetical protein